MQDEPMSTDGIEEKLAELLHPEAADGEPCSADLYRYASGDMTDAEAAQFKMHLAQCDHCRTDLSEFELIGAQPTPTALPRRWRTITSVAVAAAAMIAIVLVWGTGVLDRGEEQGRTPAQFRPKSGYKLHLAIDRGGERFTAAVDQVFEPNDVIGFFYTAPKATWPVILHGDGQGKITRIFPADKPVRLPAGVEQPLPVTVVVEQGRDCEWIAAFFDDRAPQLRVLERAFRQMIKQRRAECVLGGTKIPHGSVESIILNTGSKTK